MTQLTLILAAMIPAGFVATYLWRALAVVAVTRIDPESDVLLWVRAVSTALVAALVMRMVIAPSGILAAIAVEHRLAAVAIGIGSFYAASRSTQIATFATVIALALLHMVLG
ncbi:MAG: AzlD domain-containing protein [Pseudomonadota bacterium]